MTGGGNGASGQESVLSQKSWTLMLKTVGGEGVEEGKVGGKGDRWATEDRARKRCLLSTGFMVKLNITARENNIQQLCC